MRFRQRSVTGPDNVTCIAGLESNGFTGTVSFLIAARADGGSSETNVLFSNGFVEFIELITVPVLMMNVSFGDFLRCWR